VRDELCLNTSKESHMRSHTAPYDYTNSDVTPSLRLPLFQTDGIVGFWNLLDYKNCGKGFVFKKTIRVRIINSRNKKVLCIIRKKSRDCIYQLLTVVFCAKTESLVWCLRVKRSRYLPLTPHKALLATQKP